MSTYPCPHSIEVPVPANAQPADVAAAIQAALTTYWTNLGGSSSTSPSEVAAHVKFGP